DAVSASGDEMPALQWWLLPGLVLLDPAPIANPAVIAPSAANWGRLLHWMMRSRRREPLNGLVLSFSTAWLSNTGDAALADAGQALRKRLDELTRVYNARMPVYIVLTNCESMHGFATWAQALAESTGKQAMGYVNKGTLTSIGEFIDGAFGHIVERMRDLRVLQGIHEHPSRDAFGLPERMVALADRLDKVLRPAFQATPYAETPLLRGLFLTSRRLRGDDHGADWFSAGLLDDVLPAQRNAWQPLERWRHWRRLLRHAAVAGWLLICVGAGIFLLQAAQTAKTQLALAAKGTIPGAANFSGGISTDMHSLHAIRHAIRSLDARSGWEKHWMPYQSHVTYAQTRLEQAYTDAFYRQVLATNLNPLLADALDGTKTGQPDAATLALAQNLVRRINLLDARLDNQNLSKLPSPGPELTALMPAIQQGTLSPVDGLLFGVMYRDYLTWQKNTYLLTDEQHALQKALSNLSLASRPIQWIYTWASLQPQLQPMRMTDFWDIPQTSGMAEVPAAMTLKGKQAVTAFLHELARASGNAQAWNQRDAQYQQLFLNEGLQRWYAF
ncbi:MAG TPA: type VI secretion system protein, partial [Pusillimonas sp.]